MRSAQDYPTDGPSPRYCIGNECPYATTCYAVYECPMHSEEDNLPDDVSEFDVEELGRI